ncbi:hypothetical protein HCH39_05475 [Enterobacter kobei]|uniref:hypothetical protein n=1 Tax=Enterobacter kobei TaxID=208224 RepID=UPI001C8CC892|nr:hypothetical protein [Enterobacter kobei]ELE9727563.1 hypothetical protein [Enterobacter kobei]MBX8889157.1 hypothetical protein [Enterobacter kobei]
MKAEKKTLIFSVTILVTGVILVVWNYVHRLSLSSTLKDPANFGVLGDYLGGTLNPLISLVTLFYLIRTYLSQKKELSESGAVAQKTAKIQLMNTLISASYEKIALYRGEMEGVTRAMNSPGGGRSFTAMDGNVYYSDSAQKVYRQKMADKIKPELDRIDKYLSKIESLSN